MQLWQEEWRRSGTELDSLVTIANCLSRRQWLWEGLSRLWILGDCAVEREASGNRRGVVGVMW